MVHMNVNVSECQWLLNCWLMVEWWLLKWIPVGSRGIVRGHWLLDGWTIVGACALMATSWLDAFNRLMVEPGEWWSWCYQADGVHHELDEDPWYPATAKTCKQWYQWYQETRICLPSGKPVMLATWVQTSEWSDKNHSGFMAGVYQPFGWDFPWGSPSDDHPPTMRKPLKMIEVWGSLDTYAFILSWRFAMVIMQFWSLDINVRFGQSRWILLGRRSLDICRRSIYHESYQSIATGDFLKHVDSYQFVITRSHDIYQVSTAS